MTKEKKKKLTKQQLLGIGKYRRITITILSIMILISIWFKIGLNINWHLNYSITEILTLFILIVMGIIANIKNDFPIFHFRNFELTKEFTYSIITFFSILLLFIIYKNIVDPQFITDLANLSFHDLFSILVLLLPILILMIYLIYFSFKIIDSKKIKQTKKEIIYSNTIENSITYYKSLTIKSIFLLMSISLWVKVGFKPDFVFYTISTELFSIILIILLWIFGNLDNKLEALYNCHIKIDRYLFYSFLLPYLLIIIYSIISSDFRIVIGKLELKEIISLLVYMSPLFFIASTIFYIGCRQPYKLNEAKEKIKLRQNKETKNVIIALIITLTLTLTLFIYCFTKVVSNYNLENILQAIIIFIPLAVVIYIIIYTEIKQINK